MIMGERGTLVKLTITDPLSLEPRYVDVKRDMIVINSVEEARMLGAGVGYIMLSSFQDNTTIEMIDALKNLSSLGMRKLILDLRGNGGGTLENAVDVASMFIPDGETVTTLVYKNKDPEVKKADATQTRGKFPKYDIPIVVLVDGRSASASEVLSGALRDHGKAVLVGEKTFGKGKVQQIYEISNKYRKLALVITVATYFTPDGRDIDADGGIEPDVNIGFDQYREAIPRLGQIETEIDRLRSEMIGYHDEIVDSMLENDIVLESVRGNFDGTFDKGMESRESREKTDSADDDTEDAIDNATPGNVESGDGDKPVVDGKGADESQPFDENPIGSIRDNRNSIRC
jgi:C-terminal peptidase prc